VVFLFILALITPKLKIEKIWQTFFVISVVSSTIVAPFTITIMGSGLQMLPASLQQSFASYLDPNYINYISTDFRDRNIFSQIFIITERLFTMFTVLLLMINRKQITSKQDYSIYLLLLIISTFATITISIPSLGQRYFKLTYPLIAYIFLKYFNYGHFRLLLYIYPFMCLFTFYMSLGVYYWTTNSWDFYFLSPFYTVYKYLLAF
jgi:hypothetical protein